MKKAISLIVSVIMLLSVFNLCFANDTLLSGKGNSYSTACAISYNDVKKAYKYISSVIDCRYIPNLYDIIFVGQYRLPLCGGDKWIYYNENDSVTLINDNILGNISIYPSKGCNSYARYAAKYIRGIQGTTYTINQYLGKQSTYVPTADEIKKFVETYADVGERILTCYYNTTAAEIRPHSFLFLCEDENKDGFYYLCQDGDGYGQTLRYITYNDLKNALRYYDNYNYCFAIGDTNSGKDSFTNDLLFGDITGNLQATYNTSQYIELSGWAINTNNFDYKVSVYVDSEYYGLANLSYNSYACEAFPSYVKNGGGFTFLIRAADLCTGSHTIALQIESEAKIFSLGKYEFTVENSYFLSELPTKSDVYLKPDATIHIKGWAFDACGDETQFYYSIDGDKRYQLTTVERYDVLADYEVCSNIMCGYDFTISSAELENGNHTIHIYAKGSQEFEEIVSHDITVTDSFISYCFIKIRLFFKDIFGKMFNAELTL